MSAKPEIPLYLLGLVVAACSSAALTFVVRDFARRAGLVDPCSERKVHVHPVPRIGGVAIVLAVAVTMTVITALFGPDVIAENGRGMATVIGGALAVHIVGLIDDVRPMRARWKFLSQVLIACAVYLAGLRVTTLSLPFVGVLELGNVIGMLFTVLWLVGITNAFNLIDGLDGLAAGAALFALTTMFVVASLNGLVGAATVTIILAGATAGFLVFNFHPASIFLGDSGSLFVGFMLAGIGLLGSQKSPTVIAVAIPIVSLGLPVLDTTLAVARRFLRGQPIFTADRAHIHHRLLSLGHSPRRVALLLYSACALLGLGGMLLVNDSAYVAVVLLLIGLGVGLAVQRLRYYEFEELARLLRRGVHQRKVIGRNVRIREASLLVSDLTDLDTVFQTLESTFAQDEFECAEVRLRRSFVGADRSGDTYRRLDDDVPVWAWHRSNVTLAACWEIRLPFLAPSGERIGSLVLWQDGRGDDVSLADMHAIAHDLRAVVERKLLALWPTWAEESDDAAVAMASDRPVPIPRTADHAPAGIERERATGAAKGDANRDRSPRTSSGSFRLRSAPLT
ncbi:MAG TPA: MraY family glycosyltransferase [Gemmatimonadaceae bacterium]|nr:MraY family glycosyltransferase [Gemmatimonadaceae bacterium]